MRGALSGVKIADFTRVLAGPYATMLLADLGAEVIKVERPEIGDETRDWKPPVDSEGRSTYFLGVNRNKTGLVLNLTDPADQIRARDLILSSDVVIENFGAGGMAKFGLDYKSLKKLKPELIYCSITGFGSSDKAAQLPGYDMLIQAMSGLMHVTGDPSGEPTKAGVAVIDVIAGLHASTGILAALRARDEQGIGQLIEIDLFSSALSALTNQSSAYVAGGVDPKRLGNHHPSIVPYGIFTAKDRSIAISIGNDRQFSKFAELLDINDSKYNENSERVKHRNPLIDLINEKLQSKSASEWIDLFRKNQIPAGPINTIPEAFIFAESIGLKPIVDIAGAKSVANPIKLSETPAEYRKAPPTL
ncbi:MAG: CoA transferase [Actinomycetales bacterium]|nr:CoA transferase [Actinomycetales bacterium]